MSKAVASLAALVLVVGLAGCVGPAGQSNAELTAAAPPCLAHEAQDSHESDFAVAARRATLPNGVTLNPGLLVLDSANDPGMVEIVAGVCSTGMTRKQLIESGNALAKAIYASPNAASVTLLLVSPWIPSDRAGESLERDTTLGTIETEFERHKWDADTLSDKWWG